MTNEELKYHIDEEELHREERDAQWIPECDCNELFRRTRDEEVDLYTGVFKP